MPTNTSATGTQPNATQAKLMEMLGSRVPTSFLDSGGTPQYDSEGNYTGSTGGYGRHQDRNAGRDWMSEQPIAIEVNFVGSHWQSGEPAVEVMVTLNVFHWLDELVEYEPAEDALWRYYADLSEHESVGWLELMESFPAWRYEQLRRAWEEDERIEDETLDAGGTFDVRERRLAEPKPPTGIYGEGRPFTVNTYNGEDALSQVLQYTYWSDDGEDEWVLLQIHQGADVRGGYTSPVMFRTWFEGDSGFSLFDNARAGLVCTNDGQPEHNEGQATIDGSPPNERCAGSWSTDNAGYSWTDVGQGHGDLSSYPVERGAEGKRGVLVVDEDTNTLWCPVCGRSRLWAWYF